MLARVAPVFMYLLLSLLYLAAIPFGESPDEPGHLQCVQQVALLNRLPIVEPKPTGDWWKPGMTLSGRMCYHMPAYYVAAGLTQKAISALTGAPLAVEDPIYNDAFGETGVMFQHPDKSSVWQIEGPVVVTGLRLLSIALGGILVWASGAVAQTLFPASPTTVVAAGVLAAGWPQFLFLSRAISNDVLANAMAAITLVILLRIGRPVRYTPAALFAALAVLAKINMVFVIAVTAMVWLAELAHYRSLRRSLWRNGAYMLIVWALTAAAALLTPTIRDNLWSSSRTFASTQTRAGELEYWIEMIRLTLSSGWVRFGWMNVTVDDRMTYLWWSIVLLFMVVGVWRWWGRKDRNRWLLAFVIATWVAGNTAGYIRINLTVLQPQFRFLLSLLPIIVAFSAGGFSLEGLASRTVRWAPVALLAAALIAVNIWIIFGVVAPHYQLSVLL